MNCPKCYSDKVTVSQAQTESKMKHNERGCLWTIGRWFMILITCGLWLLVGKSKGSSKYTIKYENHAICQNCGYDWVLKK